MLVVHHLSISQSERNVWLCEELEIPYQLIRYDRDPQTRLAPDEYKAFHPFGTAPVIVDNGVVLAESGAIIDYIISKYGDDRLTVKANSLNFAEYLFWYHFFFFFFFYYAVKSFTRKGLKVQSDIEEKTEGTV